MIITSLIIFYLASCYGAYKFVQVAHSKGGKYSDLTPNGADLFVMLCPLVNTIYSVEFLLGGCTSDGLSSFFKVKK